MAVKTYGDVSTKTAPTQKLLSDIHYILGDYEKAEQMVSKALAGLEKQFGRNHIEVARSLSQLALIKFIKEMIANQSRRLSSKHVTLLKPSWVKTTHNMPS